MQRFPRPRLGQTVEGHSRFLGSLFKDRLLDVGRVRSFCSYQGVEHVWVQ